MVETRRMSGLLVMFLALALLFTSLAASTASANGGSNDRPSRVMTVQTDGGRASVQIHGLERRQPDGKCSPVIEVVKLSADAGVEGLVLETEVSDNCQVVVSYFGEPRPEDEIDATESVASELPDTTLESASLSGSGAGVQELAAYRGNYLHSRHRLHDVAEITIADFWLHNDRSWNGSNVFVCSPGWSGGCFVGGQSKTYKSWNHPGPIQLWYNQGCNATSSCYSVTADGTGNFTTDFFLCDPGDKIQLHNTNIAYRNGSYDATYWRTSECNIAGMHAHYAVWSNLTKWDETP